MSISDVHNSGVSLATSKDCKDQLMEIIPLNELMIGESYAAYLQTERLLHHIVRAHCLPEFRFGCQTMRSNITS